LEEKVPSDRPEYNFWGLLAPSYLRLTFSNTNSVSEAVFQHLRGGADKSLARPGRKQATATKLGIYSAYSPQSSIHFLARCSNFCKPLKKNSEGCPSNQVSAAAMTSALDENWRHFSCFSVQRTGGSLTGPDPENRVGDQDIGMGQFLLVCKCPVRRGMVMQEQDPLGELPVAFFLQNVLQLHQQR